MALFGGGGGDVTSKMTRPGYLQDWINQLYGQIGDTNSGNYVDRGYVGLNQNQQDALNSLSNSGALNNLINQYMGAAGQGVDMMNNAYGSLGNLMNQGNITGEQISNLANQLYDEGSVNDAIKAVNSQTQEGLARNTLPALAEQYSGQAGFGSGGKAAKSFAQQGALQQMQGNAQNITDQAYNSALGQAQGILSGNRQNQAAALGGLSQIGSQLVGLGGQAGQLSQQQMNNMWNAGLRQQMNEQGRLDNDYMNALNGQNWGYQDINNILGAAGILNGALGQTSRTKTSGGGGGFLGGAAAGAGMGSMFGPWGALAGGVIGGLGGM